MKCTYANCNITLKFQTLVESSSLDNDELASSDESIFPLFIFRILQHEIRNVYNFHVHILVKIAVKHQNVGRKFILPLLLIIK